jgi:predicted glycoside hydrolase/deacetylase ChbG (UPF0249 family)
MSWESNQGAIEATTKGVATSLSMMMPCPWIPGFFHYLKDHPDMDAGLHLTFTSEWKDYRWGPVTGKLASPGLCDTEGALWPTVEELNKHATADEIEAEIRAQVDRARAMGFEPTHMDSHMGAIFSRAEYLARYVKVGVEFRIPVMVPGGHNTMIAQLREVGKALWSSGLPVLDDIHNLSYNWQYPANANDDELRKFATGKYIETIGKLKPGLTLVIMHCTAPSETFKNITSSGTIRKGDLLAMTDPAFRAYLEKEKIILTTWREVMKRRQTAR